MVQIEFDTREFEMSHGKAPKGRGSWAFEIAGVKELFWAPSPSTLAEAKKAVRAHIIRRADTRFARHFYVKVMP